MMRSKGISSRPVADTPIAVIDFETTGLTPGYDRVVETSVVRIDPGAAPRLVFDTLVNPQRAVAATEVHGITDDDVRDAPCFADIAGDLLEAISGCVVAAYNVYFDIGFLHEELKLAGRSAEPPHLCVMYMRPLLGLGKRCSLGEACRVHAVPYEHAHCSAADGVAAAGLLTQYLHVMREQGIRTFGDLSRLKSYKFFSSFDREPCPACTSGQPHARCKSRSVKGAVSEPTRGSHVPADTACGSLHAYWETLKTAITDLQITDDEVAALTEARRRLKLRDEQVRVLHARVFMNVLAQFTRDERIDERECRALQRVVECLRKAGWAPGE